MNWDSIKTAVNERFESEKGLEIRHALAQRLRPNSGFEDYFYGLDREFVKRIDSDWMLLWHTTERPRIKCEFRHAIPPKL